MRPFKSGGSVGAVHPTDARMGSVPAPRASVARGADATSLRTADALGALSPATVTRFLIGCVAVLTVLHVAAVYVWRVLGYDHALGFVPLFYIDFESNAPTWFSSAILLLAGLVALVIGNVSRAGRWHWTAMGLVAVFLSFDESAQLHETISAALRRVLAVDAAFSWTIVALVMVLPIAIGGALFFRFVRSLPRETTAGLLAAGAVYVMGVLGIDTIAAIVHANEGSWLVQTALNTVEELFEMAGVILAIHVLLTHLARLLRDGPAGYTAPTAAA